MRYYDNEHLQHTENVVYKLLLFADVT